MTGARPAPNGDTEQGISTTASVSLRHEAVLGHSLTVPPPPPPHLQASHPQQLHTARVLGALTHNPTMVVTLQHHTGITAVLMFGERGVEWRA